MRLADFILANREPILAEWETFARSCLPASGTMDIGALRDHADEMLTVIAADLKTPQTAAEGEEKSMGLSPGEAVPRTPAGKHGAGRANSGFVVEQMVSEFRALRASVIRLWSEASGSLTTDQVEDLTRFNEAIDQALAESVTRYNREIEQSKEIFLAILGHDLRTPLAAIHTSARFMLDNAELPEPHRILTSRIGHSATRTMRMVGDLLDFTRSRLGEGIPVLRAPVSMDSVVREVVDEIAAAHPECQIRVQAAGERDGEWDQARLGQALSNVIGNAVEHHSPGTDVTVTVRGEGEEVSVAIHNHGKAISPGTLDGIFNPMKAKQSPLLATAKGPTGSLGLGLYIAERIVGAHGGRIDVESSDASGTTFTLHLPRGG